jgi:dihydrofolate reductase
MDSLHDLRAACSSGRGLAALILMACASPMVAAQAPCANLSGMAIPASAIGLPTTRGSVTSAAVVAATGTVAEHCLVNAAIFPVDPSAPNTDVDDQYAQRSMSGFGAFILGRNMFGPIRGEWPDEAWKGWWGDNPPYHAPTYILTHHARPSIELEGGTTFHFVTDGIESALRQARAAAGDKDVKIGGGVDTVRQYLRAGLIDDMHLAVAPVVLGQGEALFAGLDLRELGFRVVEHAATDAATHLVLVR